MTHIKPSARTNTPLRQARLLLTLVILFAMPVHADTPSMAEEYSKMQQLTGALGRIRLSHRAALALLEQCTQNYPHLSDSAGAARTQLTQANKPLLDKARQVEQHLVQSIARTQNSFNAEKFALEIDIAVQNTVSRFEQTLANYPHKDRHYVCNRLILSVQAGEWDAQSREPQAAQTLREFE